MANTSTTWIYSKWVTVNSYTTAFIELVSAFNAQTTNRRTLIFYQYPSFSLVFLALQAERGYVHLLKYHPKFQ